jgi:acetyltransferase-like isoleucine patch superfamily enzyme
VKGVRIRIGQSVFIGDDVELRAGEIEIGDFTEIRNGCRIIAYERFRIGRMGTVARRAGFHAREVLIGDEFYSDDNPIPLTIGGGGSAGPKARISIGHRCVMHNNHINVSEPVVIGDDVGFSPDAAVFTHGFWNSVLEGYPATFAPVTIGDHVWLGFRCLVLPGVTIGSGTTIAAGAVVTSDVPPRCVAAGVPAKVIKRPPDFPQSISPESCNEIMKHLMVEYADLLCDKGFRVSRMSEGDVIALQRLSPKVIPILSADPGTVAIGKRAMAEMYARFTVS